MNTPTYDFSDLKRLIRFKCGSLQNFATMMGMSYLTLYGRFTGRSDFRSTEILTAAKILGLKKSDIHRYFLTVKVAQVKPGISSCPKVASVKQ